MSRIKTIYCQQVIYYIYLINLFIKAVIYFKTNLSLTFEILS